MLLASDTLGAGFGQHEPRGDRRGRQAGAQSCRIEARANASDQEGRMEKIRCDERAGRVAPGSAADRRSRRRHSRRQRPCRRTHSDDWGDINMESDFRRVDELLAPVVGTRAARLAVHHHLALVVIVQTADHLRRGHHAAGARRGRAHTECGHERSHHEWVPPPPIRHVSILAREGGTVNSRPPDDGARYQWPSPR